MVRIQTIRERTRGSPRPASQGEGVQRLLKTPRVFQRCTDVRHLKRNELRANLLPCILQTGDTADCTDETVERSEKYKYYKSSLGSRDTEADDRALSEWDPARQAAQACTHLRDLAEERCRLRPVEELVNTSSNLPFVHKDQDADLDEMMNALTVEIQNLETRRGNQSFTSLQIASRVPLLVKDPDGISMETQCLPNDVHTLRLDLSPKEVRHIAYNMKSRHLKGSALERRLVAVVDPEHSTLASLVRSLRERETNAEGLVSVLNDLLREVAKELPTDLKSPALERMQTILAEPRRTLTRLLSVSDRLAALAQPLVASLAQAIDRMALICVREVDRLASFCHAEFEKLLSALYASEEARKSADEFVDRLSGRNVGKDMHSRLKNMENELHLQARSHAKLIEERNQLEAMLEEEAHAAAALRVKVKELEQEMKYRRQQAWKAGSSPRSPLRGHAKSDDSVDADDIDEGRSAASSVKQISPPLAFAVSESVQTETEFYFCKDDDLPEPAEMSFHQHADALWTVSRLFRLLCKYEWNDKTASFLHKSGEDLSSEEEPMPRRPSGPRRPSLLAEGGSGGSGDRAAEIRRLKGKVEAAHQQAATAQLKEQVACLQLLVKSNFDSWMSKMLQEAGSSHVFDKLPSPDKLFAAVIEVTQTGGLQRRIRELEDNLKRLIPMSDRLRQNEGGDSGFWKRIMRAVRHSMTARRGSSAMKGKAIQRANSSAKVVQINSLARLHGELALVWQAIPPKAAKLAAGTLLLRPMAPQALQEALKNFYLKSCGRHKQVENAIFNLCRAVLQFASSYKVLLFAVMSDIIPVGELNDRLPKVVNDISPYGPSLHVEYLGNLPFDAAQTMNEFMLALKNIRRSRQFVGSHDGSFEKIQMGGSETERRGPELEKEDALLPVPLILAAGHATICSRSKLTARCFNLLVLGYARRPKLLQNVEDATEAEVISTVSQQRPGSGKSEGSISSSMSSSSGGVGEVEEAQMPAKALLVSHLIAADRMRRHPDMWEETAYFVDSLWEAIMKTVRKKNREASRLSVLQSLQELGQIEEAAAEVAAQVTVERFRLQVPEILAAQTLLAMNPDDHKISEGKVSKDAVNNLMRLWQQCGGAASMCLLESHALWSTLWAMALERAYEVQLMGKFFDIFDESRDGSLQYDEFVNFMAHIAPAVPEADCASLFMAVAEDTSADMTQEVFLNLVQRVGVSSDLDGLENLVKTHSDKAPTQPEPGMRMEEVDEVEVTYDVA